MSATPRLRLFWLIALSLALVHCLVRFSEEEEPPSRTCGNGTLNVGEACDDGNRRSHDGCSSGCTVEDLRWTRLPVDPTAPPGRMGHAMVFSPVGERVLLFGGQGQNGCLNDTWAFDGATWSKLEPANSPAPRTDHAMVYDRVRQRVVLFGGRDENYSTMSDTWVFDGGNWIRLNPLVYPTSRSNHRMIYDRDHNVVVLFGGVGEIIVAQDDTWELDGDSWSLQVLLDKPPGRYNHGMAFDPARHTTVLFGGTDEAETGLADTWEYDGEWTLSQTVIAPSLRSWFALATDLDRAQHVLFGGLAYGGSEYSLDDTWEFNGSLWEETTPPGSPSARFGPAAVFDPSRRWVVLFGGGTGFAPDFSAETWSYRYESQWPDERCDNGVDDDSDELVDCEDDDCERRPCPGGMCLGGACI